MDHMIMLFLRCVGNCCRAFLIIVLVIGPTFIQLCVYSLQYSLSITAHPLKSGPILL